MFQRGKGNKEGDVVLIHYQDKPMAYARIEAIEPDVKKDWYQVTLLLLTIPAQSVTWILREAYVQGETFTMGGQSVKLEEVRRQNAGDRIKNTENRIHKTGDRIQDTGEERLTEQPPQPAIQSPRVIPFKKEK